jgi:hypothetical protein
MVVKATALTPHFYLSNGHATHRTGRLLSGKTRTPFENASKRGSSIAKENGAADVLVLPDIQIETIPRWLRGDAT